MMGRSMMLIGGLTLAAIGLLTGCSGAAATESAATEVPVVAQVADGKVVAEGIVEPARSSELSFEIAGDIITVLVEEGNAVEEGDPLVQLETEDLARALTRAEISLRQAQLQLEQLQEPPDERDLDEARAAVSDAVAAHEQAQANLTLTENGVSVGEEVRATRAARDEAYRRYERIKELLGDDDWRVQWTYDVYLDLLGAYNRTVENAELQMVTARNDVTSAYHALQEAQRSLDKLLEGADDLDIEAAQLEVEAALLAIEGARSNLEDATLVAPFDGIVAAMEVKEGDTVAPGQAVVVLAMLDQLQVRTTDLTELDVAQVAEGQPAVVTVDALPDDEFAGVVSEIALQPGDYRGDVVYAVTVDLTDVGDAPLRWGMTALVAIETR